MEIAVPNLNFLIIAPQIVVFVAALVVLLADLFLGHRARRILPWLSLLGVLAAAVLSFALRPGFSGDGAALRMQDMLSADAYAFFLNLVVLVAAALAILFSVEYAQRADLPLGEYYALLLVSTAGMMLMAAAINLMTIFLALEILSIALYVLVGMDRGERRSGEAALKYFLLGAFASAFLLYGMALVYGQTGSASLAAVRDHSPRTGSGGDWPMLLALGLGLMVVGFGFKVALVPFHMWTPDVYHGAPTSVTAFMSVGAKAAGFAALGRVLIYAFGDLHAGWSWLLAALAALTMTVGNLAALRQTNLKRMLAYSSIAHAGYILVGLAAGNPSGTSGILYYLFAYAFMNLAAFAVIIAVSSAAVGSREPVADRGESLEAFAGLAHRKSGLAAAMALCMLSLAGVPPLAGFVGKLYVFGAAVQAKLTWLAIVGVVNSVVSAYYYLRVILVMYMQENGVVERVAKMPVSWSLQVGAGLASAGIVVLGVWPTPILDLAASSILALFGG